MTESDVTANIQKIMLSFKSYTEWKRTKKVHYLAQCKEKEQEQELSRKAKIYSKLSLFSI